MQRIGQLLATLGSSPDEVAAVQKCEQAYNKLRDELAKVIVGQNEVIEQVLIAIFSRGHALLEGVPGLAKTLMISTLAKCLSLDFSRIQFTPDLMPADIVGSMIMETDERGHKMLRFQPGPVFAHLEIGRAHV